MKRSLGIQWKFILLLGASVGFSLMLAGGFLFAVFIDLHSRYAREQIATAAATLRQELLETEQDLLHLMRLAATRDDLVASMNLISEYQTVEDYQAILFDVEKQQIAAEMAQLLRTAQITYIAVYDARRVLSAFALAESEDVRLGIMSYHNGSPSVRVTSSEPSATWQAAALPAEIAASCVNSDSADTAIHYRLAGHAISMEIVSPILRRLPDGTERAVGVIKMAHLIDVAFVNKMAQTIHMNLHLFTDSTAFGTFPQLDFSAQFRRAAPLFTADTTQVTPWLEHGTYFLRAYALPLEDGASAYLVLGAEKTLLAAAIRRTSMILAAVLAISALVVSLAGIAATNTLITRPIDRLMRAVEAFKHGRYQAVDVTRADEIGTLARSFQAMATTIQQREQEVKTYQEHLEDLVEQRTHALEEEILERRQIEQALRESKELYQMLTELSRDMISLHQADGVYLYVSPACEDLFGYRADELLGQSVSTFLYADDIEQIVQHHQRTVAGERLPPIAYRMRTKAGEYIWVETTYRFILNPDAGGVEKILCVSRDVTSRKAMETALQESQQRYARAEQIAHFGYWERSLSDNSGLWSDETYRIFGVDSARFPVNFENLLHLIHPDDRAALREAMAHAARTGERVDIEYRIIRPDSTERTLRSVAEVGYDAQHRAVNLIGVVHDITERRHAEEQIRKLSTAVEQSPGMVVITDVRGVIEYVNPKFTRLTHYAAQEVIGKTPRILRADYQPGEHYQRLWETILSGSEWQGELLNKKKNGERYWEFASISPIRDARGRITHFLKVAEDITDRKHAEEELVRAKEAALEARRAAEVSNRAKSEFLANMSHELRTPLNGILGYTQILRHAAGLQDEHRRAIDTIHRSGEHLLTMINDILDLSKIEAGKVTLELAPLSLTACLSTVIDVAQMRALQKGIEFVYAADPNLPRYIVSDETRLRQVLLNILGNAIKFTEYGSVTLRISDSGCEIVTCEDSPSARVHQKSHLKNLKFEISDTGIGIPSDKLEQIFLPFEQVHDSYKHTEGTGLGLAISQKILRLLGSELYVTSTLGEGSTFWFDLRVAEAGHVRDIVQDIAWERIGAYTGTPRTILVVDDIQTNRMMLKDILAPLGFEVLEAVDGRDALRQAAHWHPDLVLMDLIMPEMDGFEATRQLRVLPDSRDLPIIGMSASVFEATRAASLDAGCNAFLARPVKVGMLLDVLSRALGLEWIYQEPARSNHTPSPSESARLATPPPEVLDALYQAAQIGDIASLQEQLDALASRDPACAPFVSALRQHVETFHLGEVRTLLAAALDETGLHVPA